jgi:phosphinothricin acetyltransferase
MEIKLDPTRLRDTQAILDVINYNILNSTALYDYNIATNNKRQLDDKINKRIPRDRS